MGGGYQFFAIFAKFILQHEPITIKKVLTAFAKIPFGPPWYHLWYLYMLVGLYLLTPLYRVFTMNATEKQFRYLLFLFCVFGICLPFLKKILLQFDSRFVINFEMIELANYSGYFFAGYYFSKYTISKKIRIAIHIFAILSFLFTILGTSYISIKNAAPIGYLYGYLLPTTMFETFSIFIFTKNIVGKTEISEKKYNKISELSSCTFGIYLIHDFIIHVLVQIGITSDFINPLFAIPFTSILIFLISFLIIFLLRKILISKYIM